MTTDEFLAVIEASKKRDDVVHAYASCFPFWVGVKRRVVDDAIVAKWSKDALSYIRMKAWRIRDRQVLGR